jgi:hypothetical protein
VAMPMSQLLVSICHRLNEHVLLNENSGIDDSKSLFNFLANQQASRLHSSLEVYCRQYWDKSSCMYAECLARLLPFERPLLMLACDL